MAQQILDFGKWMPDTSFFANDGLAAAENVVKVRGKWRAVQIPVQTAIKGPLGAGAYETPISSFLSRKTVGASLGENYVATLITSTTGRLYFVSAAGVWTDVLAATVNTLTGVSWTRFGSNVIAAGLEFPLKSGAHGAAMTSVVTSVLKPQGRYCCAVRSFLILANCKETATYYPNRIWWSARDNAADFQPGSNRAGFTEIPSDLGELTGIVGFEDFAVIFTRGAVFRLSYTGGDIPWSLQRIASSQWGKPHYSEPAVFGRDVYYYSQSGLAICVNGEATSGVGVGSVAGFLANDVIYPETDVDAAAMDRYSGISMVIAPSMDLLAMRYKSRAQNGTYGSTNILLYSIGDDAASVIPTIVISGSETIGCLGSRDYPDLIWKPLSSLAMWSGYIAGAGSRQMSLLTLAGDARGPRFTTKLWRASQGVTSLDQVRLLWDSGAELPAYSIAVKSYLNPQSQAIVYENFTLSSADMDARGFLTGNQLPRLGEFFRFDLTIVSGTQTIPMAEVVGLEVGNAEHDSDR